MTPDRGDRVANAGASTTEPGTPRGHALQVATIWTPFWRAWAVMPRCSVKWRRCFSTSARRSSPASAGRWPTGMRRPWSATAHALRGAVSNFAADDAAHAALTLEMMGRDGDFTGSDQALRALEEELGRLRPALEELR